jgi:uncharacterized Fe-S cluster-containing protein
MDIEKKRKEEKEMLSLMVSIYCEGKHKQRKTLCPACEELLNYAHVRTDQCPFMETKTFCSACKVHCYSKEMREKIKEVMRYSGPRMLFYHPGAAVRHMAVTISKKLGRK